MVGQQKFQHALAGLLHHFRFRMHHHAFGNRQRAADLQLRSLLDLDQAHAAGSLKRQAFVITEGRNFDSVLPRRFDQQSAFFSRKLTAVHREFDHFRHCCYTATRSRARRFSKSSANFSTMEMVGIAAASPSAQKVLPSMFFETSPSRAMSS